MDRVDETDFRKYNSRFSFSEGDYSSRYRPRYRHGGDETMSKKVHGIFYRGYGTAGEVLSYNGKTSSQKRPDKKGWRFLVLLFCLAFFAVGCPKKPPETKSKPKRPRVVRPVPPPPKGPEALSPKREASQNMIDVGERYLGQGDLDKATQTFQEAINIDSDNGVAYYYLAKVMYQKSEYDDALGLLEKSEGLLGSYPEWVAEVARLKKQIEEAKQNPPNSAQKPEEATYY